MTTTRNATQVEAPADLPVIRLVREFDAPRERVFRAWVDPELFVRWVGPRSIDTSVDVWDARSGGEWRYTSTRGADFRMAFWGCFHQVREPERLVQTFTFEGEPDGVSLETMVFEELPGGRTRIVATSVVESFELRDQIVASGMETGVVEGYEKLDALLAEQA